jgi:hypothetical protein
VDSFASRRRQYLTTLEKTYDKIKRGEDRAMRGAKESLSKYFDQFEQKQSHQKTAERGPDDAAVEDVRPAG